ncbi:hypothetical protein [Metapseudomonas otitidis]|uniref:hypothetical protein n=1 Tax=Metapseudomonas otitidis TaxID=319939 RepID=UPI00244B04EF|nr:hypothetical protein [Pseudomonas otitidis]MDH0335129.1 hypothetical protein [Pseudomonas otitidis]
MEDKELLELAAKAAGYTLVWSSVDGIPPRKADDMETWNPLTDDGDALRLAAKLELEIQIFHGYGEVWADSLDGSVRGIADVTGDRASDYRNAIVIAAAEIGRAMK